MPLARGDAVAVVDLDHLAVAARPFGRNDTPRRCRTDGGAVIVAEINFGVHGGAAEEWVNADAKAGRDIGRAGRGLRSGT